MASNPWPVEACAPTSYDALSATILLSLSEECNPDASNIAATYGLEAILLALSPHCKTIA